MAEKINNKESTSENYSEMIPSDTDREGEVVNVTTETKESDSFELLVPEGESVPEMTLLLIGSTGMGKSTLGNYLIDPSEEHTNPGLRQTFKTAESNQPETKHIQVASVKAYKNMKVMDTPGLNDDHQFDIYHMAMLVGKLQQFQRITSCAIVIKFQTKIDAQFCSTIRYYSKLLPQLFENNVFIVMTDFQEGETAHKRRQRMGIDVKKNTKTIVREIRKLANMMYNPTVFRIDCLPIDDESSQYNANVRSCILDYVFTRQTSIDVTNLKVCKSDYVKQKDEAAIAVLNGNLEGYTERLIEMEKGAEELVRDIESDFAQLNKNEESLTRKKIRLRQLNTEDLVTIKQYNFSHEWSISKDIHHIDYLSEKPIKDVEEWSQGNVEWEVHVNTDDNRVTGKLTIYPFRRSFASLAIKTFRKLENQRDIVRLETDISDLKANIEKLSAQLKERQEESGVYAAEVEALNQKIISLNKEKEKYFTDYMTLEEAIERANSYGISDLENSLPSH